MRTNARRTPSFKCLFLSVLVYLTLLYKLCRVLTDSALMEQSDPKYVKEFVDGLRKTRQSSVRLNSLRARNESGDISSRNGEC